MYCFEQISTMWSLCAVFLCCPTAEQQGLWSVKMPLYKRSLCFFKVSQWLAQAGVAFELIGHQVEVYVTIPEHY
jgi:hypothetical protein